MGLEEFFGGAVRLGLLSLQVLAAVWVYQDARWWSRRAWWWGLLVAAGGPVAFPAYVLLFRPAAREWGLAEVLAVAAFGLLVVPLAASLLVGPWAGLAFVATAVLGQSAALLGGCWQVLRRSGQTWAAVGLSGAGVARQGALGVVLAAPVVAAVHYGVQPAAVYLLGLVVGHERARMLAELEQWSNPLMQAMPPLRDWPAVLLFAALVCGVVPLAEEVFFRGLVYRAARRRLQPWQAAGLVAVAFAAVHLQVVNFLPIAVLGWAFAWAAERTGSLVPSVAMHAANNLVALVVAYAQR